MEEKKKGGLTELAPQCELVDYKFLPAYLKDNQFILKYYRAEWPLKQTFLSIFCIHNETLNIWTHLIGFFIFLALMACAGIVLQRGCSSARSLPCAGGAAGSGGAIVARWPFFTYLAGAMACLLSSSACHLLSCHSRRLQYVMRGMDCTGITVLIVTSFYPGPEHRMLRAKVFFCMGLSGVVPIMHKVIRFGDRPAALVTTGYEAAMGVLYALATVVYSSRMPERWMPGTFDILGHSHQLFHVLVVAAAYTHYLGAVVYLQWRDSEGC
ncbi:unnamed protein product [Spirodela intermedia]|uniref:Uncharacterized protein n=1 Tax=Spirodela intermedia TaxID=51605 RepID=A0A7I8IUF4_SPIIN|nr:unnamed protein product [Spirodela intermedia]CAA6661448.1 unnamed protein product [Spirodela intermedia]